MSKQATSRKDAATSAALPTIGPTAFKLHADKPVLRIDLTVPFGDGVYNFKLGEREMNELQDKSISFDHRGNRVPAGIMAIYGRMSRGRLMTQRGPDWNNLALADAFNSEARKDEIYSVIRLGLIGGKGGKVDTDEFVRVTPSRATQLIEAYVSGQPIEDGWMLAFAILGARVSGRAFDPVVDA